MLHLKETESKLVFARGWVVGGGGEMLAKEHKLAIIR